MSEPFVNRFAGSPLNRLSWLRSSHSFLNAVAASPATRWILFNAGEPLLASQPDSRKRKLALLSTNDVKPLLGPEPYFGQGKDEGDLIADSESKGPLESARHRGAPIIFLGLEETESNEITPALPTSDFSDAKVAVDSLKGTPYFSLDVRTLLPEKVDEVLKFAELTKSGQTLAFHEPRSAMGHFDVFIAAVFAEARSMIDWNDRNKFCPACGSRNYSMWAGWKLSCSSLLPWADNTNREPCPTARGLHNFTHPRTDAVVIMLAIDETGEKALLGRSKKFPGKFYSALAGFIEPGESFEDAVKREMWEEAGVKVWNITYHSGQPWPFPANLMVGFYARADSSQPIRTDLDNELEDARWYTRAEVLSVLNHPTGTNFTGRDHKKLAEITDNKVTAPGSVSVASPDLTLEASAPQDEPLFKVPPATAIAGVLIKDWAMGKVTLKTGPAQKGLL